MNKLLKGINNDYYGNPRYICHYTYFLNEDEDILDYNLAFKRAKQLGFKKYRKKNFEYYFVCSTYNTIPLIKEIKKIHQSKEKIKY